MWLEMVQWSMGMIPGDATPRAAKLQRPRIPPVSKTSPMAPAGPRSTSIAISLPVRRFARDQGAFLVTTSKIICSRVCNRYPSPSSEKW